MANKNLKYLRKLRGWTQEEFAQKLRIKRSLLGAYEEERADPRMEVLEVVADMFKLSLDELLRKDLAEGKGTYLSKRRAQKLAQGRGTRSGASTFRPAENPDRTAGPKYPTRPPLHRACGANCERAT